jgi:hypothetical protein
MFDKNSMNYQNGINSWFHTKNPIPCRYDEDDFFQTALKALFTYEIDGKAVSLLDTMKPEDREAFIARLDKKMKEEYNRYLSYASLNQPTTAPFSTPTNLKPTPRFEYLLASAKTSKARG